MLQMVLWIDLAGVIEWSVEVMEIARWVGSAGWRLLWASLKTGAGKVETGDELDSGILHVARIHEQTLPLLCGVIFGKDGHRVRGSVRSRVARIGLGTDIESV